MFRFLEHLALNVATAYLSLPAFFSALVFGVPALFFFIKQFQHRQKTFVPGVVALILAGLAISHAFAAQRMIDFLVSHDQALYAFSPTRSGRIPVVEPLFSIFVAPAGYRYLYQEFLFVLLLGYFVCVALVGLKEYKRDGQIIGRLALDDLLRSTNSRPVRSQTNELGSADLATADQISQWTKPRGAGDTKLAVTDLRGSEGVIFKSAHLIIPREERNRHILTVAKTGGGKTTRVMLPVLYGDCMDPERSTIIIDSKPEMWRKLATMTRRYNPHKNIMLFNPLDADRSLSWNILEKIEDDTDAKLIANSIIMATDNPASKADSPFFRNNALMILNAIMVGLLHDQKQGKDKLSMPRVHELVQSGMKPLADWLEARPYALKTSRTFIELARSGSQNADTIMSELGMRVSAWDLHAIRATTAISELDIEKLIEEPTLFIVEFRESELEMLRPLANVIVVELLRYLTKAAEKYPGSKLPRPVGFVIDEFASALGRIPDIQVKLNTLRSRNVSIVAAIQSIGQIKANYGDDADSVLAGFSTKFFIPPLDIQDAEWASKETGQMTIRFQTSSIGSSGKLTEWFSSKSDTSQEQVQQRAVLTPDEIGRPPDGIGTYFFPNTPAFQGHLVPHYKNPEQLKRITEFDNDEDALRLREQPIPYVDSIPTAGPAAAAPGAAASGLPPGITNTKGWNDDQIKTKLEEVKKTLDWDNTTGSARKWWEAFEKENLHRMALVLRLAEELQVRKATITEFFLAYVYSNTDNIQANLSYLDYTRLKKQEEQRKREAAAKAKADAGGGGAPPSSQAAA
jgi:type IV secretion system protein VirD4